MAMKSFGRWKTRGILLLSRGATHKARLQRERERTTQLGKLANVIRNYAGAQLHYDAPVDAAKFAPAADEDAVDYEV